MVKILPFDVGAEGSIPGEGAKIPYASQPKKIKTKQKQYCNKFNTDFLKMAHIKKFLKKKKKTLHLLECFLAESNPRSSEWW